jgi:hypothetical protein
MALEVGVKKVQRRRVGLDEGRGVQYRDKRRHHMRLGYKNIKVSKKK